MNNAIELERWAIVGLLAGLPIEGCPIQIVIPTCSGNDDLVIAKATAEPGDDMDVIMERARLIAAAPDLLAACKLAVRFVEDVCKGHQWPHENCEAWKAATAAIAKAKGE